MRKGHYITLLVAVALIGALYWGVNTKPPKKEGSAPMQAQAAQGDNHNNEVAPASTDSILTAASQGLHDHALEDYKALETKLKEESTPAGKAVLYAQMATIFQQHKQSAAAAYYYMEGAKLENSEKSLNFAARLNSELLRSAEAPSVKAWAVQQAIAGYEQSMKLNPDNDTIKMALAACYIDGTAQPMNGIQLLLGITREEPNHIPANLMLGQLSIRSGQLDKAAERFEKVISIEPENTEALYFLAEVYKGQGKKEKAIELLEKCKKIINNPDFSREIDNYIKTF